jgi:flagellar biogenesis protein FliO
MMSMMGWGMMFNMIFWILIVGLIIYAVLRLVFNPFEKKRCFSEHIEGEICQRGN